MCSQSSEQLLCSEWWTRAGQQTFCFPPNFWQPNLQPWSQWRSRHPKQTMHCCIVGRSLDHWTFSGEVETPWPSHHTIVIPKFKTDGWLRTLVHSNTSLRDRTLCISLHGFVFHYTVWSLMAWVIHLHINVPHTSKHRKNCECCPVSQSIVR